jgi:Galactose oxidase, central domain
MILFGGSGRGTLSDTWEFNPGTRQWREAVSDGPAPSARFRQESAYGEGITYFFGG